MQKDIKRIAIFRALQLGDILCSMPAIRAIRAYYPAAEITFIGLPGSRSLIERFSECIDDFIEFSGYPGLPEQDFEESRFLDFMEQVKSKQFHLLFQMQGNGTIVYDFLNKAGAKRVVGFCANEKEQNSNLLLYPDKLHEVDRHLALLSHLNIPCKNPDMFFPLSAEEHAAFLPFHLKPKEYICIHPGSRAAWRQWPIKYFAALADYCIECGYKVLITGSESERHITKQLMEHMVHTPTDLTGKTSLGSIGGIIQSAFGLIANCTGVSHIAAAVKTPSVIISMDGEPQRWGPKNKALHTTLDWISNPDFDAVFAAVKLMLAKSDYVQPAKSTATFSEA